MSSENGSVAVYGRARELALAAKRPDVPALAKELVAACSRAERVHLTERGAAEMLRAVLAEMRRPAPRAVDRASRQGDRELDLARITVYWRGEYRWLLDCDEEFLRGSAVEDSEMGEQLLESARRKQALADALAEFQAATIAELDAELVRQVWCEQPSAVVASGGRSK